MQLSRLSLLLGPVFVLFLSCSEGDPSTRSTEKTYSFVPNPTYNGAVPLYNGELYLSGFSGGVSTIARITLNGTVANKKYPIHIHQHDFASGTYDTEIAYNLGDHIAADTVMVVYREIPANIRFLTEQFKGHFIVHDPNYFSNVDTTLLIIGPVGQGH